MHYGDKIGPSSGQVQVHAHFYEVQLAQSFSEPSFPRQSFPSRLLTKPWSGDIFRVMGDQTHILRAITVLVGREIFATGIQLHIPGVQIGSGAAATAEAVAGIFGGRH